MSVQSERTKLVSCVRVFVKFVVFIVECAFRSSRTNEQDFLRNGYLQAVYGLTSPPPPLLCVMGAVYR